MAEDVRQWLLEIKTLQQKLESVYQERDEAYVSAANWRKLYETEAEQRRTETYLARQTIEQLNTELEELRHPTRLSQPSAEQVQAVRQAIAHLPEAELRERLVVALLEVETLGKTLRLEQAEHGKTRQGLTVALGDTVDMLAKERSTRNGTGDDSRPASGNPSGVEDPAAKSPSLERPPLSQAQSLV